MQVLSTFSKGIKGSRALSFGLSARTLCDKSCQMLQRGLCYAERPEKQYKDYYKKLRRHRRINPANLIRLAKLELEMKPTKWFRFSVSGSLPSKSRVKNWAEFAGELRSMCIQLLGQGTLIHMPVESMAKARTYRNVLKGLPIVVRRTIQTKAGLNFNDHAAFVVDDNPYKLASEIRLSGKTVVVCPAVKPGTSKCGKCTACASDKVDLILYPLH